MFGSHKNKNSKKEVVSAPAGYVKVAKTRQVPAGQLLEARAGKVPLALANVNGTFYAFSAHCPHQGWPLWSGSMQGEQVRCFLHRWQFNVRTGENTSPGVPVCLPTYPLIIRDGEIWVDPTPVKLSF